jgi:hypothetical protein
MKRNTLVRLAALALVVACTDGSPTDPTATAGPEFLGPSFDIVDDQQNGDVNAVAKVMPLNVGGANGTTTLYITPTSGDGKNGCNLTGSTTLTVSVSSNNSGVATVSPSSATFTACGDTKTLTVTPVAQGTAQISVSETSNNTGATFNFAPATFTVNVAPPPNTAPTISVAGVTGGATYNKGSVPAATCQVTDAEDGNSSFAATLSAISGPFASDGIGLQKASCSYTDGGGLTAAGSETYSIVDPSAPTIASILDPTAPDGLNGWYKSDVDLTWNVGELQSPNSLQKTGCIDQNITADQAATTYDCSATSAGGSAGPLSITIKRDATAPSIDGSGSPAANGFGWNNTNVAVSFTCDDNLSGVASCGPGATKSIEGANQSVTGNAADKAGNTNSATVTVSIDKTDPTISGSRSPAANGAGWNKTDVAVSFLCADALSGIDSCPANQTLSSEGADLSASGTANDKAGNSASTTVSDIKIDKTAPTASANKSPAANTFGWNKGTVTVSFTGLDALSGIANCDPDKTLASEGANQLASGNCTDNAGNESAAATATAHIDKTAPTISGGRAPGANANGWNNADVAVSFTCADALSGVANCGPDETVSAEGEDKSVTGNAEDYAGNTASATVTGISIDKTDPTISGAAATPANANGWYKGNVTVEFTCTDALSGIDSCPTDETLSGEGANQSASGTANDKAGNSASATVSGINIDKTVPTVSTTRLPAANANGWNKADVTVSFTGADLLSGIDACTPASKTLSGEGENQSASGTCADLAGNSASATVSGISIDKTNPTISGSRTPAANGAGWNNADVAVSFTCADGLSGVDATGCPADRTLSGEGASQSSSGTVTDNAGNSASATISGISIDKTAPTINGSRSLVANANGWNNADVTVSFACSDALSGIASCSDASTLGEGANQSVPGNAADKAGNTASTTVSGISVDKTAPTVGLAGGPAAGSSHYFGSVPAAPTCSASDALSGLASCIVSGYSTAVGSHTVTATATDKAGNTNAATAGYTVLAWTIGGFFQPVDIKGILNTVKNGSTVPLKFTVNAGTTALTTTDAVQSFTQRKVVCDGTAPTDEIELVTTGGTSLRYDTTAGQFIQNWKTPTGVGICYQAVVVTKDGSTISALFKLK